MEIILLDKIDKRSLLSLFKQVTRTLRKNGVDQWDIFYPNRIIISQDLKRMRVFGIKDDNGVIGVITVDRNKAGDSAGIQWQGDTERACSIQRLAVHPDWQGAGLGKKLLRFAEDMARQNGWKSMRLDVYSANPAAVALYQKADYLKRGEIHYP